MDVLSVEKVLFKALTKDPKDRYERVLDFATDLERTLSALHWLNEGNAYYLGQLAVNEKALTAYEQVIYLDPTFVHAYNGKGNTLLQQHNEEALAAYEEAIRLDPTFARAHSNKGDALYFILHRREEALTAYEHAIRLDSKSAQAYHGKLMVLMDLERAEELSETLKQLDHLSHYLNDPYSHHTDVENEVGPFTAQRHFEKVAIACEQACYLDPNDARTYYEKGLLLLNVRLYKEALASFEQATLLDPNFIEGYYTRGQVLYVVNKAKSGQIVR